MLAHNKAKLSLRMYIIVTVKKCNIQKFLIVNSWSVGGMGCGSGFEEGIQLFFQRGLIHEDW